MPDPDYDLVTITASSNPLDLSIARDLLERQGVQCRVVDEQFGRIYGSGPAALQRVVEPRLVVFRKDARRAAEALGLQMPDDLADEARPRRSGLKGFLMRLAGLE